MQINVHRLAPHRGVLVVRPCSYLPHLFTLSCTSLSSSALRAAAGGMISSGEKAVTRFCSPSRTSASGVLTECTVAASTAAEHSTFSTGDSSGGECSARDARTTHWD